MNKDELRKIYLAKRLALTDEVYHALSLKISDLFFKHVHLAQVKTVHIYLPIVSKREPDTWPIIEALRKNFPSIQLVVPKVKGEQMQNILWGTDDKLEPTKWGMVEPTTSIEIPSLKIDVAITPLLIVDQSGHRVGYGKGFYDRLFSSCRSDCKKIGLSFFEPEQQISDIDPFDVPLNQCITPSNFYQF